MKKLVAIMFMIGALLMLVDVDSMMMFMATKVIGLALVLPAFKVFKFEE